MFGRSDHPRGRNHGAIESGGLYQKVGRKGKDFGGTGPYSPRLSSEKKKGGNPSFHTVPEKGRGVARGGSSSCQSKKWLSTEGLKDARGMLVGNRVFLMEIGKFVRISDRRCL